MSMLYFAYGSNMSTRRLQQRLPQAQKVASAHTREHRVVFHKVGNADGSGKCGLIECSSSVAHGVVFELSDGDVLRLDKIEGVGNGYERVTIPVCLPDSSTQQCVSYLATRLNPSLKPFHWYRHHVLTGAREHDLPELHVQMILDLESITDPDEQRHQAEMAIYQQDY